MELPEDVLVIIREYARPRFKYFREYNNLMKLLRKKEWKSLKAKLQLDPEPILSALLAYQHAIFKVQELYQDMAIARTSLAWNIDLIEQNRFYNMGFYRRKEEEEALYRLNRILYPNKTVFSTI